MGMEIEVSYQSCMLEDYLRHMYLINTTAICMCDQDYGLFKLWHLAIAGAFTVHYIIDLLVYS